MCHGKALANSFYNRRGNVSVVVHGDNFFATGPMSGVGDLIRKMEGGSDQGKEYWEGNNGRGIGVVE